MQSYSGKKFSKDQLIFVVELALTTIAEEMRIEFDNPSDIEDAKERGVSLMGHFLSIFYCQMTGEGMGVTDIVDILSINFLMDKFKQLILLYKLDAQIPDYRKIAEDFVNVYILDNKDFVPAKKSSLEQRVIALESKVRRIEGNLVL